ncbi:hypothetical protein F3Y22_tig00116997pilonHSYRG00067 [Hibiscus syriacus]|uniref:Uncharacterized protein n=1 Tax=Hibiscus syriacus TaxID=106335 RepID=A0A6A2X3W7_HIBSY|nr:hypothetical protein F3Y22_tig00116997pilonHSYRG00067 [Hibiscus syriacus]
MESNLEVACSRSRWVFGSWNSCLLVAKISLQTSFPSEYTRLVLLQTDSGKKVPNSTVLPSKGEPTGPKMILLGRLGVGFGNLTATAKNIPPGVEEPKSPKGAYILVNVASKFQLLLHVA